MTLIKDREHAAIKPDLQSDITPSRWGHVLFHCLCQNQVRWVKNVDQQTCAHLENPTALDRSLQLIKGAWRHLLGQWVHAESLKAVCVFVSTGFSAVSQLTQFVDFNKTTSCLSQTHTSHSLTDDVILSPLTRSLNMTRPVNTISASSVCRKDRLRMIDQML